MLVPVLGALGLYGLYSWYKTRNVAAVATHVNAVPNAPADALAGNTVAASNPSGSISYTAPVNVPGFNVPIQHVVVQQAPPGTSYPPATTQTDPSKMAGTVIAYQAATPVDSGKMYYPASGDLWPIVQARLGGTPKARIMDPKNNKSIPLSILSGADVGKLNGILSLADFDAWLKAGKPLKLPAGGWNDVSGPVQNAMGSIR
jgi:hypothetical protein